jgi:hypothetical protein
MCSNTIHFRLLLLLFFNQGFRSVLIGVELRLTLVRFTRFYRF